ncbi:tripartite motif containing 71 protein wech [Arctopsyche grandis]|uniref:tripartite motif containing 71 protein wech n=1 Tax=Arctopsyche grandis TaxID=121162 RepID=UPI00406D6E81
MALIPNSMNFSGSITNQSVSSLNSGLGMNKLLSNLLDVIGQNDSIPSTSDPIGLRSSPTFIPSRQFDCDFISSNILHTIGKIEDNSLSESPQTSSSAGSLSCSKCDDRLVSSRCLDCNETFCHDCLSIPSLDCCTKDHTIIPAGQISPAIFKTNFSEIPKDFQCDVHCETLRYYCETCSKIVCQECTLWEHKDHICIPLQEAIDACKIKVQKSLESGKMGTKFIKHSIDRAVAISRTVERDAAQISMKIRKAMRHFILAIEERERQLLEKVGKMRQMKLNELSDQMHGLRNALAGLAQTNDYLTKAIELDGIEILLAKDKSEAQIELFAGMYKNLQPKDEGFLFISPNFELIMEIKKQGDVMSTTYNLSSKISTVNNNTSVSALPVVAVGLTEAQRAVKRPSPLFQLPKTPVQVAPPMSIIPNPNSTSTTSSSIRKGTGQCIPGSTSPVYAKTNRNQIPSTPLISFGTDGHEDGQLSRPWGLCVDRDGNIIVADRRNNRVQVFSPEGLFKLKFGTKGTAAGEFDLPAGITTDPQGRIVVVDKDNHRVQIFTPLGGFVLMFGTFGKSCGQFRYPWDVAINSERQIVVTDSRNYRIQLFNSEGVFITMLMFDGSNHSRMLKGLTTPRGVCFTPLGDIIISDFENHRLLLIDSSLNTILGAKGYEGLAIGEFSRPSGIICDDEGKIIVADSKNQRVIAFSPYLDFLWALEVKGKGPDDNDRPTDIGLTQQGRLVVVVEGLPDSREVSTPGKTFIQIF